MSVAQTFTSRRVSGETPAKRGLYRARMRSKEPQGDAWFEDVSGLKS